MKEPLQKDAQQKVDRFTPIEGKIVDVELISKDSDVTVKPRRITISSRDQVRWSSRQNDFRILFSFLPDERPFKAAVFAVTKGNSCVTGKPIKLARVRRYSYTAILLTPQGPKATDAELELTD